MTTGPVNPNSQVNTPYQTQPDGGVEQAGAQHPAASGDHMLVTHADSQDTGAPPPPGHDIEDRAGPVTADKKEALRECWTAGLTQSVDFVALMGDLFSKLRQEYTAQKATEHGAMMKFRLGQHDLAYKAADDEKALGKAAMAWSIISGVSEMTVGGVSAGIGIKTGDMGLTQASTQVGSGLTAPLGGAEKMVEGDIKHHQERAQADSQMSGELEQDMSSQTVLDALKDALQALTQVLESDTTSKNKTSGSI